VASVADLVESAGICERAGEYLERAGQVLRESGRVRLIEFGPTRVTAEVEDDGARSVVLDSTSDGLRSGCDCGAQTTDGLCPHVVAVAIETWHRAPDRR
jgi:uncharacterized Zn finger protein